MCVCLRVLLFSGASDGQTAMATSAVHLPFGEVVILSPKTSCSSLTPISSYSLQKTRLNSQLPGICRSGSSSLCLSGRVVAECLKWTTKIDNRGVWSVRAQAGAGSSAMVAKEMERLAAKEALLLSIKDAGGLKVLSDPGANDKANIDVNEKILNLERLNPTLRPTTSPVLEGLWQFIWAGAQSPGLVAVRTILGRFPPALASIESLTLLILDGSAEATGFLKVFNTLESSFSLVTKLTVEGPLKLKEEYAHGLFATPTVREGTLPPRLKGVVDQISGAFDRLPDTIKDVVNGGVKFPLTGTFSRELLISYLDDEVMVVRDKSGVPDVLLRLDSPTTESSTDYQ